MPRYDEVSDPSGCIRDAYSKLPETPPKSTTVSRGRTWSLFPNKSTTFKVSSLVLMVFAGILVAGIVVAAKAHAWNPLAKVLTATGGAGSVTPLIFTILNSRDVSKPKATKRTPKKTRSPKKHSRANRERFRPQTLNRSSSTSATGSPVPLAPLAQIPTVASFWAGIQDLFRKEEAKLTPDVVKNFKVAGQLLEKFPFNDIRWCLLSGDDLLAFQGFVSRIRNNPATCSFQQFKNAFTSVFENYQ